MSKSPKTPGGDPKGRSTPDQMDVSQEALFREVEEDLRSEQMQRLWKRFGGHVIAAALVVVLVVAGFEGWKAWQSSVRSSEAQRYFAADTPRAGTDAGPAVGPLRDLADEGRTGYAALAALRRAEVLAAQGDAAAAILAYDALSADGSAPQAARDLATMLAALHALDTEGEDSVRGRLRPLTQDDSPWRPLAEEMLALLAMESGDVAVARATYQGLASDRDVPDGVRRRAADMLAALGGAIEPDEAGSDGAASVVDGG
ncbi:tetratricopeptide repeat protein [Roseospira visakhapatnamensis]|uniref:Ancillary SecYEG translocon subunit/Cell division coordinator CpoB TPR domain-containing protein n=1 Tax=Roseospira visakhapatnamensis TaxID=390880 RepID=A0A7W6RFG1_9PROT|nr:tetratricopeptide repeat protein [Roseospira visakhapatnamensis]MBB4267579.1 hypothetical protein [Roseospira visakhapatnamensis]